MTRRPGGAAKTPRGAYGAGSKAQPPPAAAAKTSSGRAGAGSKAPPPGAATTTPVPARAGAKARPGTARGLALQALLAIDRSAARANVLVPELLGGAALADRDRAFVTELVYGTLRMQRACDWLVDRHLRRPVEPPVRAALRLGAYQLAILGTPAHAGVSATVAEVKGPARGLVNAVLRRIAEDVASGIAWPGEGVRLSYPDWIVAEFVAALGPDDAHGALEQMNVAGNVTVRVDGYVQDRASQWAAEAVMAGRPQLPAQTAGPAGAPGPARAAGADPAAGPAGAPGPARAAGARPASGERILDLCAAPGGKATWLAGGAGGGLVPPSIVVAGDSDGARSAVIVENVRRLGLDNVATIVADGSRAPFPPSVFDRVLVDAPCSGLGVLRRRPDARWRVQPGDVPRLARLQRRLLEEALAVVRPGGLVVYSVCTLTEAETVAIDRWLAEAYPEAVSVAADTLVGEAWEPVGRGARLLPQAAGTDGMYLLAVRKGG